MFVNSASYVPLLISLLSFFANFYSSRPDTDMCRLQCRTVCVSLSESLSESALIPLSIVPSPPITQNQEKHTPTQDWGSDKIKNTRQLIWITEARSIRIVRDSEPDGEAEIDRGMQG